MFDTDYVRDAGHQPDPVRNPLLRLRRRPCPADPRPADGEEPRLIACAITDINGYLPTHITERSQPQSDDPDWNAEHCRNRRNFLDDVTRRAIASDKEAMLATYGMDLGQGRYLPVKNVFVPLYIRGRRWGNFELAYRDETMRL